MQKIIYLALAAILINSVATLAADKATLVLLAKVKDQTEFSVMLGDNKELLRCYQQNKGVPEDYFQKESDDIVKSLTKKIQDGKAAHEDMTVLFFQFIEELGSKRAHIAFMQDTRLALEQFGKFRDKGLRTCMGGGRYVEYGLRLRSQISDLIETQSPETIVFKTETFEDCTVTFERSKADPSATLCFQQTITQNGKAYVLSTYPFFNGMWHIHHQHPLIMIRMMRDMVAEAFIKCVYTDSEDVEKLKKNVAFFRWLFSHATPYSRGSAAIGEWFESAIYGSHGYRNEYVLPVKREEGRPTVDLDALTTMGVSSFIETYKQRIRLHVL